MTKYKNGLLGATFIDLFAGIGGFHLAMQSVGAKCVFASELDEKTANVYEKNFKLKPFGDITKISEETIPEHKVLCGGFPCQAFSISGKRLGFSDTRGTLFFDVSRIIKWHNPDVVFLENVKNFASHDNGNTLSVVKDVLDKAGYDVFHQVINAAKLGFATARERIYIVGFKKELKIKELGTFKFPTTMVLNNAITVKDCLQKITKEKKEKMSITVGVTLKKECLKKDFIKKHLQKIPHSPIRVGVIGAGGQGNRIYSIDGPAITFSAYGGGRASKTGAYLVGDVIRKLTPREAATVMGFPSSYILAKNESLAYKQLGNSVVVGVVSEIAKRIDLALKVASELNK